MLARPGTTPITDPSEAVVGDGYAIVGGQQIAPGGVGVAVEDGVRRLTQIGAGGVVVLGFADDVAALVVLPDPGFVGIGIVLPPQLVQTVVGVGEGDGTVVEGQNIANGIVGIGISDVIAAGGDLQRLNLGGGQTGTGAAVGVGVGDDGGTAVLGHLGAE